MNETASSKSSKGVLSETPVLTISSQACSSMLALFDFILLIWSDLIWFPEHILEMWTLLEDLQKLVSKPLQNYQDMNLTMMMECWCFCLTCGWTVLRFVYDLTWNTEWLVGISKFFVAWKILMFSYRWWKNSECSLQVMQIIHLWPLSLWATSCHHNKAAHMQVP